MKTMTKQDARREAKQLAAMLTEMNRTNRPMSEREPLCDRLQELLKIKRERGW